MMEGKGFLGESRMDFFYVLVRLKEWIMLGKRRNKRKREKKEKEKEEKYWWEVGLGVWLNRERWLKG